MVSSDRLARAIALILEDALQALEAHDWPTLRARAEMALGLDPENTEARRFAELANRAHQPATAGADAVRLVGPRAESAADVAARVAHLAPFPVVASRVLSAMESETNALGDIARIAASDADLTTTLLRAANSAAYARRTRAATVREAITVLGVRETRRIALAACAQHALPAAHVIALRDFWRFSVTVALLSDLLLRAVGLPRIDSFCVGVVHNIGLAALDLYEPDLLRETLALDIPGMRRLQDRELAVFGFTDTELGAALATQWRLPESFAETIALTGLRLNEIPDDKPMAWGIVHARIFARSQGLSDGAEQSNPTPPLDIWDTPRVAEVLRKIGGIDGIMRRVDAFLGAAGPASTG